MRRPAPRLAPLPLLTLALRLCSAYLPHDLSNFQGNFWCSAASVGRPSTVGDVQVMVAASNRVRGVGAGHSWRADLFCAGHDGAAVDVVTTSIVTSTSAAIAVDEARRTAKIEAGVILADALDYLASYGKGWTLARFLRTSSWDH